MADAIREDNEVARRIEQLAWTEKNARKMRREKLLPGSAGSVKDEHGVGRTPCRVFNRFAESRVVQTQFRQGLARMKLKIVNDKIAFRG